MIRLRVGRMDPIPPYWQNFIRKVHDQYWRQFDGHHLFGKELTTHTTSARQIAITMLKPYGGTIANFGKREEIRFKNKHDFTIFMLKWS